MAGIGSLMIAALQQRNVVAFEVEIPFLSIAHRNAARILDMAGLLAGRITVGWHDARQPWRWSADHLIFSPPYGCNSSPNPATRTRTLSSRVTTLSTSKVSKRWRQFADKPTAGSAGMLAFTYGNHPAQIGHWRGKRYWSAMTAIYGNARQALPAGGLMILVLKDHIRKHRRVHTSDETITLCEQLGFRFVERHERHIGAMSMWQRRRRERGEPVVEHEDVLVFQAI